MNEQSSESKPAAKSGNSAWIVRIVVFGILGALLVVAVMDFNTKRDFEAAVNVLDEMTERPLADAEKEFVGSYEVAEGKDDGIFKVKYFIWKGLFREFKVKVTYAGKSELIHGYTTKSEDFGEE